jgi:hypothetical protein
MLPEILFSIKISYIDENGLYKADTTTLFYHIQSYISTRNAFIVISEKIKEQLNLNCDQYIFIKYPYTQLTPYNTNSILPIYKEFNSEYSVPFYIHIHTHETFRSMLNYISPECPICLNNSTMINPYRCGHGICNDCYIRCRQTNNNSCCYCRESIRI